MFNAGPDLADARLWLIHLWSPSPTVTWKWKSVIQFERSRKWRRGRSNRGRQPTARQAKSSGPQPLYKL